ncbi:VOC family protein [bacterium]|nr:VOC family protein [bacterium]
MKISGIDLVFVYVSDLKKSICFYKDILGMELIYSSDVWAEFFDGGTKFALWKKEKDFSPEYSRIFFAVPEVELFCSELVSKGIEISFPPTEYFYGKVAEIPDPDGNIIGLYQRCERK